MVTDDWHGLYSEGWKGEIVEAAFKHPAKFSRALVRHIYQHCKAEGWLAAGDRVCDPFGGVGLGALDAMRLGLHWTGVELEQTFAELGTANIEAWNTRYGRHMPAWGTARLLQGDSRGMAGIVGAAQVAVSSPPYATSDQNYKAGWARFHATHDPLWRNDSQREAEYGATPGQLSAMSDKQFAAAISSPPYADAQQSTDGDFTLQSTASNPTPRKMDTRSYFPAEMGTPGQLGAMRAGGFEAAVSSPPWDSGAPPIAPERVRTSLSPKDHGSAGPAYVAMPVMDDFWLAARAIVEQVYTVLAPGGHACWVVKDFVRSKKVVPFSDQWRQLCEAAGFVTLHEHHAWVVEQRGTQLATDGSAKDLSVSRKSFFRRLAEKKGSPAIDWETVYCMERSA